MHKPKGKADDRIRGRRAIVIVMYWVSKKRLEEPAVYFTTPRVAPLFSS